MTGYIFTLGRNVIRWKSSLQHIMALSTTEAEYVALTEAIKEAMWLKGITNDLGIIGSLVKLFYDSQSAIHLLKKILCFMREPNILM